MTTPLKPLNWALPFRHAFWTRWIWSKNGAWMPLIRHSLIMAGQKRRLMVIEWLWFWVTRMPANSITVQLSAFCFRNTSRAWRIKRLLKRCQLRSNNLCWMAFVRIFMPKFQPLPKIPCRANWAISSLDALRMCSTLTDQITSRMRLAPHHLPLCKVPLTLCKTIARI